MLVRISRIDRITDTDRIDPLYDRIFQMEEKGVDVKKKFVSVARSSAECLVKSLLPASVSTVFARCPALHCHYKAQIVQLHTS